MSQVMIAYEKRGLRIFDMTSCIGPVAKALLQQRVGDGYWYHEDDLARAKEALSGVNPRFTPWHFLASRRDHEYERVEIYDVEKIA